MHLSVDIDQNYSSSIRNWYSRIITVHLARHWFQVVTVEALVVHVFTTHVIVLSVAPTNVVIVLMTSVPLAG
jgi:hypothetical protein